MASMWDGDLATQFLTWPELSAALVTALSFLLLHLQKEWMGSLVNAS